MAGREILAHNPDPAKTAFARRQGKKRIDRSTIDEEPHQPRLASEEDARPEFEAAGSIEAEGPGAGCDKGRRRDRLIGKATAACAFVGQEQSKLTIEAGIARNTWHTHKRTCRQHREVLLRVTRDQNEISGAQVA